MRRLDSVVRTLVVMSLCTSRFLPCAEVHAQTVNPQQALAAQALYDEATTLMDAKNFAAACPKLEEVTRLAPNGVGAKLTLGDCYEKLGKLASAWAQFALAEPLATRLGQSARALEAASRAAALRPRLATLTIDVAESVRSIPGLTVVRDGLDVGSVQWGTALPVDVGSHEVGARATGYKPWKKAVEVVTDGAAVRLSITALEPEPSAPAAAPSARLPMPVQPAWDRTWQRPVGLAAVATGTAGVCAGAVLGMLAIVTHGRSNQGGLCDAQGYCNPEGLALRNDAFDLGNASTAAFIAGGATLAGGVVLFATAPPRAPATPKPPARTGLSAGVRIVLVGTHIAGQW